jgi:hypothetical protein
MKLNLQVTPLEGGMPSIRYKWDTETEILTGRFEAPSQGQGFTGSIELESATGAFILLEVEHGVMCGVEVVVWPEVEERSLVVPHDAEPVRLTVPGRPSQPGTIGALEIDVEFVAEVTPDESTFHMQVGARRQGRTLQIADNLILELDTQDEIKGLWLLNVPPFPEASL